MGCHGRLADTRVVRNRLRAVGFRCRRSSKGIGLHPNTAGSGLHGHTCTSDIHELREETFFSPTRSALDLVATIDEQRSTAIVERDALESFCAG